jgi:hypothetical protein
VESGDPARRKRPKQSLGYPTDEEIADFRRRWRLGPFLMKHGFWALVASLPWLWTSLGWTAFLISAAAVLTASVLIRAFFMRRWDKGNYSQSTGG